MPTTPLERNTTMSYTAQTPANREEFGDVELYHVKHSAAQLALDAAALVPELLADDWRSGTVRVYAGVIYADGNYTGSARLRNHKERYVKVPFARYTIRVELAVPEYMVDGELKELFAAVQDSEEADLAEAQRIQREADLAEAEKLEAQAAALRERAEALRK